MPVTAAIFGLYFLRIKRSEERSGRITIWFTRGIFATDQYDTTVAYPLNATLFCGIDGKLTTNSNGPGIAMVTGPPSVMLNSLEFLWF